MIHREAAVIPRVGGRQANVDFGSKGPLSNEDARETAKRIQEKITQQGIKGISPDEGQLWSQIVIAGFINAATALYQQITTVLKRHTPICSRQTRMVVY